MDPIIVFDEGFERIFEVEWNDGRDEDPSQNILEVVSNIDWYTWETSEEAEEIILIGEEKVSELYWAFFLEVEL